MQASETDVAIIGAGPVDIGLAIEMGCKESGRSSSNRVTGRVSSRLTTTEFSLAKDTGNASAR